MNDAVYIRENVSWRSRDQTFNVRTFKNDPDKVQCSTTCPEVSISSRGEVRRGEARRQVLEKRLKELVSS
ncbi:hypothetical protein Q7C36_010086 [Tachysurus vachellii]|uniref:Uncharacterized protein n=1 Tax=Tachysurus vachellii TaxID=175792 RepID=A0AA88MZB9_TACVA|nr:hypothetical protein Q7C36_010086 [Tachysurus vachellii]